MCGICGITTLGPARPPAMDELRRMASTLRHRGPDGAGYYLGNSVGLGHRRLSIIDLEGGAQPIANEDQSVWVVLNGEIFNYVELRRDLEQAGHRFRTDSDTEVLVHLYEDHGPALVHHLNGQFAFAIWDGNTGNLLLGRDRTGIAPLHYMVHENRLYFGSEVKALYAGAGVRPELDREALADVFRYWSAVGEASVFRGVREVPPGHTLTINRGQTHLESYWDWDYPLPGDHARPAENELAESLVADLQGAVGLRLRADVPVAAYLSGGLDSSAIVALIRAIGLSDLRTFSIGFEGAAWDEGIYQKEVVNHLGIKHSHFQCSGDAIAREFMDTIWHTEVPILRTAAVPMKMLSARVRDEGFRVVLTGEGADEAFGGYDIFKENKIRRFWSLEPQSAFRPRLLERLYPYLNGTTSNAVPYLKAFYGCGLDDPAREWFSHLPRWQTTAQLHAFLSEDMRQKVREVESVIAPLLPRLRRQHWFNRAEYLEAKILLPRYLLSSQGDRMLMANGVEGRYPYLDHHVVEKALSLDPRLKMRVLEEKYALKKAVARYLPASVVRRKKQPYRAPDIAGLVNPVPPDYLRELMSEEVVKRYGYFDPKKVGLLVRKAVSGRAVANKDNMAFVGILSTQILHYLFIENFDRWFMFRSDDNSPERVTTGA